MQILTSPAGIGGAILENSLLRSNALSGRLTLNVSDLGTGVEFHGLKRDENALTVVESPNWPWIPISKANAVIICRG